MAAIAKRRGIISRTETRDDIYTLNAKAPLAQMFGFAAELRSITSGTGEFSMEYAIHEPVLPNEMREIAAKFSKKKKSE
jgi:translation elongation factor EF-G